MLYEVITASGVLSNDIDLDGDPLTAVLDTDVTSGTLTLNSNGSFDYAPDHEAGDGCGGPGRHRVRVLRPRLRAALGRSYNFV